MSGQVLDQLRQMAEEITTREGCYLYDIELVGGGQGRVLRVYIDKQIEGGATIDDCSSVSRGLNLRLDVDDVIPGGNYNLEVSTPGLERVLKQARHFEAVLGKKILVRTFAPLAGFNENLPPELSKAKQIQGSLKSFDEKGLRVEYCSPSGGPKESAEVFVPMESVTKAHVVFEFSDPSEKKKSLGKTGKKGKTKA